MPMNLTKAIELKEHYRYLLRDASLPDLIDADNLSIEAMKHHKKLRDAHPYSNYKILPGETEN